MSYKNEQIDKFKNHLEKASKVVRSWPGWKQEILGGTSDKKWCMCIELQTVFRDGDVTCSICGGKDAYGKDLARPKDKQKVVVLPVSKPIVWEKSSYTKEEEKKEKKQKVLKDIKEDKDINNDELWICGQWQEDFKLWEFQGVFSSRAKAIKACKNIRYFIFPALLNKELPMETVIPDGFEYPHHTKGKL